MAHIGIKIKELRKKKDMTQEKLAEYLNVSFQAVSKWETGVASPDLSMIVPLARLLDVTTDELFGVDSNEELLRQEKLKEIYYETWKTGDIEKRYKISKTAVEEYPGNLEYLKWLADAEGSFGIHCNKLGSKEQIEHFERSVFYFEKIIEDSTDSHLKESAIRGIVFALSDLGRRDEALQYARQHPDRDELLKYCLKGEDLKKHRQTLIFRKLADLLGELETDHYNFETIRLAEKILKLVIDDENYLWFHETLMFNYILQAQCLTKQKQYTEAISILRKSYEHAVLYDKIFMAAKETPVPYTASVFNKISFDANEIVKSGTATMTESFREFLLWGSFDPIRDSEDFQSISNL